MENLFTDQEERNQSAFMHCCNCNKKFRQNTGFGAGGQNSAVKS
jgi:hypothetical protein